MTGGDDWDDYWTRRDRVEDLMREHHRPYLDNGQCGECGSQFWREHRCHMQEVTR